MENNHYALVTGAWGDILVSIQESYKQNFNKFIVLSNQNDIENFLLAQDFVQDVIKMPFNTDLINKLNDGEILFSEYCSKKINKKIQIKFMIFDFLNNTNRYDIYKNFNTDKKSKLWAKEIAQTLPNEFILFHPYSVGNSCAKIDHWPYWNSLIKYYINKNINVVLCGQNIDFSHYDKYDNFYDLSNITNSFQQIFSLSHYAKKIIMTSNGLSFYCASNDLRSIVIMNKSASNYFSGFNRAIFSKNIKKIDFNSTLLEAISIIENDSKNNDLYEILACFPYLHPEEIYTLIKEKYNDVCLKIINNDIKSIYSENEFEPLIFANMILKTKRFVYHLQHSEPNQEYQILENVKYFIDKYNVDVDFKFTSHPLMDYDLFLKKYQ